jgi:hypothetical protein
MNNKLSFEKGYKDNAEHLDYNPCGLHEGEYLKGWRKWDSEICFQPSAKQSILKRLRFALSAMLF